MVDPQLHWSNSRSLAIKIDYVYYNCSIFTDHFYIVKKNLCDQIMISVLKLEIIFSNTITDLKIAYQNRVKTMLLYTKTQLKQQISKLQKTWIQQFMYVLMRNICIRCLSAEIPLHQNISWTASKFNSSFLLTVYIKYLKKLTITIWKY